MLNLLGATATPSTKDKKQKAAKAKAAAAAEKKAAAAPSASAPRTPAAQPRGRSRSRSRQAGRQKAARAAATATRADMPAPLSSKPPRAAGGKRRGSAAAVVAEDPAKEETELRKLIEKGGKVLQEFETMSRETVVHEKDKRWYKQIKLHQEAMDFKKARVLDDDLVEQATQMHKRLGIVVWRTKAYTAWVKKCDDAAFKKELEDIFEWQDKDPFVDVDLPTCMRSDEMEFNFRGGISAMLDSTPGERGFGEGKSERPVVQEGYLSVVTRICAPAHFGSQW